MDYEIVTLPRKSVVGITARTRNGCESAGKVIGGLWRDFYDKGIFRSIEHKSNDCAVGIYSDYETDEKGEYSVTAGCEVSDTRNRPEGTVIKNIPGGKYAKFIVEEDMERAVREFWTKLWDLPLDRTYSGDFEEYQPGNTAEHAVIHVYIAIK